MAVKKVPKAPPKATKKNNDHRAQKLDPTSMTHQMAEQGMVNRVNPPNNTTRNNKSK